MKTKLMIAHTIALTIVLKMLFHAQKEQRMISLDGLVILE